MESKIITKTVENIIYITKDGQEFEEKYMAEMHEQYLKTEEIFGKEKLESLTHSTSNEYFIVNSEEEYELLSEYVYNCLDLNFNLNIEDVPSYPTILCYNEYGDVCVFDFKEFKKQHEVYLEWRKLI